MRDDAILFTQNPSLFIQNNPIVLNFIANDLSDGIPEINNLQRRFTLSTNTVKGVPSTNDFPLLKMQQDIDQEVINLTGGEVLTTIKAYYCRASRGGTEFGNMPYCDIDIIPSRTEPYYLFTDAMNGCSLIIVSGVPAKDENLPDNKYRVFHDRNHRSISEWNDAGYKVIFGAYAGNDEYSPTDSAIAKAISYNPNNCNWFESGLNPDSLLVRAVTNFLSWDGNEWNFNSRHYLYTSKSDVPDIIFDNDVKSGIGAQYISVNIK